MIDDDQLLLFHYRDGLDADERAAIERALAADAALAQRYRALTQDLDALPTPAAIQVPESAVARWNAALESAAKAPRTAPASSAPTSEHWPLRVAGAAAALALLVGGLSLRNVHDDASAPALPVAMDAPVSSAERATLGLRFQLAQAERQLNDIRAARGAERERLIDRALLQNRVLAVAAERAGDDRLARTLRSFAPILEAIAEEGAPPAELEGGLAQLGFELKIVQAGLAAGSPLAGRAWQAL